MLYSIGPQCSRGTKRILRDRRKEVQYITMVLERLHEAGSICEGWEESVPAIQRATEKSLKILEQEHGKIKASFMKTRLGHAVEERWE